MTVILLVIFMTSQEDHGKKISIFISCIGNGSAGED